MKIIGSILGVLLLLFLWWWYIRRKFSCCSDVSKLTNPPAASGAPVVNPLSGTYEPFAYNFNLYGTAVYPPIPTTQARFIILDLLMQLRAAGSTYNSIYSGSNINTNVLVDGAGAIDAEVVIDLPDIDRVNNGDVINFVFRNIGSNKVQIKVPDSLSPYVKAVIIRPDKAQARYIDLDANKYSELLFLAERATVVNGAGKSDVWKVYGKIK